MQIRDIIVSLFKTINLFGYQFDHARGDGLFEVPLPAVHIGDGDHETIDGPVEIRPPHVGLPRRVAAGRCETVQFRIVRLRSRFREVTELLSTCELVSQAFRVVSSINKKIYCIRSSSVL